MSVAYTDISRVVNKKKMEAQQLSFLVRNAVKKSEPDRYVKRICQTANSPQFYQLGYPKHQIQKLLVILGDQTLSFFLFLFEQLMKTFAEDPNFPMFEDMETTMLFFDIIGDNLEKNTFDSFKTNIVAMNSPGVLHMWVDFSERLFKQVEKMSNLQFMLQKRLVSKSVPFQDELTFYSTVMLSEPVVSVLGKLIQELQLVFLFLRNGNHLTFKVLLETVRAFLLMSGYRFEPGMLRFQAMLSLNEAKTEYQYVPNPNRNILVDFEELIEFLIRVSWVLELDSSPTLRPAYFINSRNATSPTQDAAAVSISELLD